MRWSRADENCSIKRSDHRPSTQMVAREESVLTCDLANGAQKPTSKSAIVVERAAEAMVDLGQPQLQLNAILTGIARGAAAFSYCSSVSVDPKQRSLKEKITLDVQLQ